LLAPLIVYSTLLIPATIVGEETLSFLGVGVQPPTADWGQMISDSTNWLLSGQWWYLLFPAWRCCSRRWPSTSSATGQGCL
jgi:peptide/nickel transport system permease protein